MYFIDEIIKEFTIPFQNQVLVFSLILFIILLSPIFLRKLKIPGIIGLIISGVIIGPHGFNILEKNSAIDLFSTIGLLYIMFIAGLELEIIEFKKNKYKSIGFGIFTFIIPLSIGIPVCYYLLHYNIAASILISSMFSTHTLVAYPIVSKFGISRNQAVATTVGGTIFTDTAVLVILAIITSSVSGGLNTEFWLSLLVSVTIFSGIIFFIIPIVTKWFFIKTEGEKISHFVYVLSILFLSAFLAKIAGLEPIIGAFIAGIVLNRLIPHSSALMNRLGFVGNSIFIPFFLISVGMLVDIKILFNGTTAILIAITLSVVAIAGKWLAAYVTQKVFKYSSDQRLLIFGLSSSHAVATLAVIMVGYKASIIDNNILNGTIILILITCIVASFATENAAKKIASKQDSISDRDEETIYKQENILISISNFNNIEQLLDFSILIKEKKSLTPINILSVVNNDYSAELNMVKAKRKLERYMLYASASETKINPIAVIAINLTDGIVRTSKEILANIIIIGWPSKDTFVYKEFLQKIENILSLTNKTIMFYNHITPLNINKRIKVLCLPLSELESGFYVWFNKIVFLAKELSINIEFICNNITQNAINKLIAKRNYKIIYSFNNFVDINNINLLSCQINSDDLFVVVLSRKGSISHQNNIDNIPKTLYKYFINNNLILIYASVGTGENKFEEYNDVNAEIFSKGIATVAKLQKGIGHIFKNKTDE
ncbi:MAG: sodium:proton antiporter [Bacteroidetes bacterium GWA2_32_17]|nr:MAG: sodium:proton antiporter [Bacteroidetes bacterium GWA2_32_17]